MQYKSIPDKRLNKRSIPSSPRGELDALPPPRLTASGQDKGRVCSEGIAGCRSTSQGNGAKAGGEGPGARPSHEKLGEFCPGAGEGLRVPRPPTGRARRGCSRFSRPRRASPSQRGAPPLFASVQPAKVPSPEELPPAHGKYCPGVKRARAKRGTTGPGEGGRGKAPSLGTRRPAPLRSPGPAPPRR